MDPKPALAVIGGSGLYAMKDLDVVDTLELGTPFGNPSGPILLGDLNGKRIAFLARHGIGHRFSPSEVNYRANIYALKSIGVDRILSVSACGSLREDYAPGEVVIPDQLFDFTRNRNRTFFSDGLVVHINVADPFCPDLSRHLVDGVSAVGGVAHAGGCYITIEGPRFSTRAESHIYRAWGVSIIGMTTSPEAFLAREAEMCYAVMAHVTDYDVWHHEEDTVSVDLIFRTLQANTELAQKSIAQVLEILPEERNCNCARALENAIATGRQSIPTETRKRLSLLVERHLR